MATAITTTGAGQRTPEEQYWRWAAFGVLGVTIARLIFLAGGQADLYPDEAQYWVWSVHPAFGYYSKPPLVAWLIWLSTTLLQTDDPFAVRLAAPLLHFATALVVFALARRLYDARTAAWSALAYVSLPGVSVSALIMSTDAPLLFCWAVALYAFVRAREAGGGRWWLLVGVAAGLGLLAKYAMAYWLVSALLFLLLYRDERRHLGRFFAATGLALLIYVPNFLWNLVHGYVSYRHTGDNAALHGSLLHPEQFLEFLGAQFLVFGPLLFAALIAMVVLARKTLADRRAALLASFALPALSMMLVVSFLSRAHANWAAPTYVSATVLVVAWLCAQQRQVVVAASIVLHIAAAALLLEARPLASLVGIDLATKHDPLHRLYGWRRLGGAVSQVLALNPGAHLLSDDRDDMAALLYYVRPHPVDALKWNGDDGKVHDGFDLTADPQHMIGDTFLLVSERPDTDRILQRFDSAGPIEHIIIPIGRGGTRAYTVRLLYGFKGYDLPAASGPR